MTSQAFHEQDVAHEIALEILRQDPTWDEEDTENKESIEIWKFVVTKALRKCKAIHLQQ